MESFDSSPNYMKATSSSDARKEDYRGRSESDDMISITSSTCGSSVKGPYKLIHSKKLTLKNNSGVARSFRRRVKMRITQPSVNRSTYSSAVKGSKFPKKAVEDYSVEMQNEEKKICRYHHCSLHGHCHGDQDSSQPSKRVLYKKSRSLKKKRTAMVKTESKTTNPDEEKEILKENQMSSLGINHSNQKGIVIYDKNGGLDSCKESYDQHEIVGDGNESVQDAVFLEVAFGEMSYPETSYRESLNIQRNYSFWLTGHCLGCSCHKTPDDANLSRNESFSNNDCPAITVKSDEITGEVFKLSSTDENSLDSSGDHTEEEGEFANEGFASDYTKGVQAKDLEPTSPAENGGNLQFSEPRNISMWNQIHQHLSAKSGSEPENKGLQGQNVQDEIHASDSKPLNYDDSEEVGDIEVRKMFAIKLVREAIEKILLPEVQDQTSDDQSVSETSNETGEDGDVMTDLKDGASINDVSALDTVVTEQKLESDKSQKKPPKHWSNLKKWILLQRFIKALERVKKLNLKNPNHLPVINSNPEKEKVNLRHQTSDERKRSEQWMLDYALRQAVDQLAPMQKRKVALLVKAFETVVPTHEDSAQSQSKITRLLRSEFNHDEEEVIDDENQERGSKLETVKGIRNSNLDDPNIRPQGVIDDGDEETVSDFHPNSHPESAKLEAIATDDNGVGPTTLQHVDKDTIFNKGVEGNSKDTEKVNMEKDSKNHHISMWHILCQHVVSGIADKMGNQLLGGSDGEESPAFDSCDKPSNSADEDHGISSNLRSEFTKSDALRMVKKAVEEILVQDDSPDTQSIASDLICPSDQSDELKDEDTKGTLNEEAAETSKNPESVKPKNWIKLKKLILLKRSIRALEKARKLKPQVNIVNGGEQEKINLRQHMMDERAKAEQWMIDYAVRNIVSKLTPSRKQRVSMLVEAFEAVVPIPDL